MTSPDLPSELQAALEARLHGQSRKDFARRAATISQTYRSGGGSTSIRNADDALVYALARMPATYAAVIASLNAVTAVRPDFMPQQLLDCGAGPGTASWAAAACFSSLRSFALLDANAALRALALELAHDSHRLAGLSYHGGDARALLTEAQPADLVIASYVINELSEAARSAWTDLMWARTLDTLLVVEPGTPAGMQRILALRRRLIAQGAHVLAPCPHDSDCPLTAPDWCHFTQRLPRSRAHQHLKGAELPYEDEKFCYVALSRTSAALRPARVLAQPLIGKVTVTAKLCTADGIRMASAARRDRIAYTRFKKLAWGDGVFAHDDGTAE